MARVVLRPAPHAADYDTGGIKLEPFATYDVRTSPMPTLIIDADACPVTREAVSYTHLTLPTT